MFLLQWNYNRKTSQGFKVNGYDKDTPVLRTFRDEKGK